VCPRESPGDASIYNAHSHLYERSDVSQYTTNSSPLEVSSVDLLSTELDGTALLPDDPGYAEASAGYNLATRRQPDVVVMAESSADVVAAVRFANEHDFPVAVMGTGHHGVRPFERGLLINTSRMKDVTIDADGRTATVGAGARWNDVVPLTAEFGLTPVHGSSGSVGVVGFTLGGGLSPVLSRKYGWGADHVVAIEAVTADGSLVRADSTENSELFWALRGGRSMIGIVTSMQIELLPERGFTGGGLFFDGANAEQVLAAFERVTATAPDELTVSIAFLRLPALPGIPELLAGKFVLHVRVALLHSTADLDTLLAPLREAAPLLADTVQPLSSVQFELIHNDPVDPAPFSEETSMLAELTPEVQQTLLEKIGPDSGSGLHIVELRHVGGALARTAATGRSVSAEDAAYVLWAVSIGMPDDNAAGIAEARSVIERMSAWSTGSRYLNFTPDDGHPETAFSTEDWDRMRQVKAKVDPLDRFPSDHLLSQS
jgi:FAD/FMN-containing dehydrogenase